MTVHSSNMIGPAKYTAIEIADYFIFLASDKKVDENVVEGITPLKLQKLLYFAQAVSLSIYNKKLFDEGIEAWKYGPVVSSLYHKYKNKLNNPLTKPLGTYSNVKDEEARNLIKGVWEMFGKYSAGELVEMTHNQSPWKETYEEGKNKVIPAEKS